MSVPERERLLNLSISGNGEERAAQIDRVQDRVERLRRFFGERRGNAGPPVIAEVGHVSEESPRVKPRQPR